MLLFPRDVDEAAMLPHQLLHFRAIVAVEMDLVVPQHQDSVHARVPLPVLLSRHEVTQGQQLQERATDVILACQSHARKSELQSVRLLPSAARAAARYGNTNPSYRVFRLASADRSSGSVA